MRAKVKPADVEMLFSSLVYQEFVRQGALVRLADHCISVTV